MKDLTKGNPLKIICIFALPIFVGGLFNLFYSLADMKILGLFVGNDALAAAGSISGLYDFLNSFIIGLCNGFGVVTAIHFGSGDMEKTRNTVSRSVFLSFASALSVAALSMLAMDPVMKLLKIPEEVTSDSKAYISIMITGLVFSAVYNCLAAALRAVGDSFTPLIFLIVSTILNTGLDVLFVGGLDLGVRGAASATVLSQFICCAACFFYTYVRYKELRFTPGEMLPKRGSGVLNLLSSGISMALMSSMVAFGTLSLQSAINRLGPDIVIAHAATRKLSGIYMLPFGVFGTAMATYSGQNYGAGKKDRIIRGLKSTVFISFVYSLGCVLVSYTVCPSIIRAITSTSKPVIIENAVLYQKIDTLFYLVPAVISIFRNSLQGMGEHTIPVVSSFSELLGKLLIALFLAPIIGYMGIIMAEPIVWIIMVIPLIIGMNKKMKELDKDVI